MMDGLSPNLTAGKISWAKSAIYCVSIELGDGHNGETIPNYRTWFSHRSKVVQFITRIIPLRTYWDIAIVDVSRTLGTPHPSD